MTASVYSQRVAHQRVDEICCGELRVFHRKKVVQLSRNNHCHAILKSIFFVVFCRFRLWLWFMRLGISPILIFPSKWCLRINLNGREEEEVQNVDAPFLFPFFSFLFFMFQNIQLLRFLRYIPLQPDMLARQLFLIKLFLLPSVDPKKS